MLSPWTRWTCLRPSTTFSPLHSRLSCVGRNSCNPADSSHNIYSHKMACGILLHLSKKKLTSKSAPSIFSHTVAIGIFSALNYIFTHIQSINMFLLCYTYCDFIVSSNVHNKWAESFANKNICPFWPEIFTPIRVRCLSSTISFKATHFCLRLSPGPIVSRDRRNCSAWKRSRKDSWGPIPPLSETNTITISGHFLIRDFPPLLFRFQTPVRKVTAGNNLYESFEAKSRWGEEKEIKDWNLGRRSNTFWWIYSIQIMQ